MANALIVGDGPGGLSAALFLAKNDVDVDVFGTDDTPMHKAMLYNYLGIEEMTGSDFQNIARGQVAGFGGRLHETKVESVEKTDDGFLLTTADGDTYEGDYIVIAVSNKGLLDEFGIERDGGQARVDRNGRTNVDDAYAIGWATRNMKIQAIISAGEGGAAALDILSNEAGEDVHDFDVVE
ncbi:MAG: FAD-dependent oxidoreductase [Persicimonas sp.]